MYLIRANILMTVTTEPREAIYIDFLKIKFFFSYIIIKHAMYCIRIN